MTRRETSNLLSVLDGTSQRARNLAALDPQSICLDERSDADLIAFVQSLTQQLIFAETNGAATRWRDFATPPAELALSTADIAAYIDHPERYGGDAAHWLGRPHFALLLTCIALLRHLREQQNGITRRHLDHYFRDQLGMTPLPARPDRVAVLFQPARGVREVLLPAGTLLKAGRNSSGVERQYRTDHDLLIRRTQVSELRTVFVDRRITTLDSLRRATLTSSNQKDLFEQALRLALGDPEPGDAVPRFHPPGSPSDALQEVNARYLASWKDRLNECGVRLHLLHQELRDLLRWYRRRSDEGSDQEWDEINRLMGYTAPPPGPRDRDRDRNFATNLRNKVGSLDFTRDGLPQVNSVDDLYRYRKEDPVRRYINTELNELADRKISAFDRFTALMEIKLRIDSDWRKIHQLLEQAGQKARNNPTWRLDRTNPTDFRGLLEASLNVNGNTWPTGRPGVEAFEAYESEVRGLELHLSMPVERIQVLVDAAKMVDTGEILPVDMWDRLLTLLSDAHAERFHARGRARLAKLRNLAQGSGQESADVFDQVVLSTLSELSLAPPDPPKESWSTWKWHWARAQLAPQLAANQLNVLDTFRKQLASPGSAPRLFTWPDALAVLEFAQRKIGKLADPVARTETWRNLDAFADARAQAVDSGRWATFGSRPVGLEEEPPEPNLGFALISPLLSLSQGTRTLELTFGFAELGFDHADLLAVLPHQLMVRVSGAKGWIELTIDTAELSGATKDGYWSFSGVPKPQNSPPRPALKLTLVAEVSVDPFTPPEGERFPMLQVLLRPTWDSSAREWITTGAFERLRLEAVHLHVEVNGLSDLVLQQEDRRLDARKPFEPFGSRPTVGSRLYVSHPELIRNRLDSLTFHLEWTGLDKRLADHYFNYSSNPKATDFKVQIDLFDQQRSLGMVSTVTQSLFNVDNQAAAVPSRSFELNPQDARYADRPDLTPGEDLRQDSRVWCWTLTPIDFGHGSYPALAAAKGRELATALAKFPKVVNASDYRVDPPYTPMLKSLTVGYTSAMEFLPQAEAKGSELLHVHPFGISRILPEIPPSNLPTFLPRYTAAAELYIGLADADPPQRLSLLVQLAEGTSDPDLEPGSLQWQILDGDRWTDLTVRRDDTAGFLHSGVVELDLPAVVPGRWLPSGLLWLRVTIDRDPASVCDCVDVHAQAVMATFHNAGNAPDSDASTLAAGSLRALVMPDARIARVEQPYSSFGGRPMEPAKDLDRRVSEGLRHKQRGLAGWDYERLVLEEFGSRIHKVKCIGGRGDGRVDVIVIPDLRGALPADALAPKAPANLRDDIRQFLQGRAPAAAIVRVRNATFLPVRIRLGVRFRDGQEERYSRQRLNMDLVRFLSPWAYDEGAEIRIGDTIYATSIIDFVDRLAYVDYVAQIHLFLLNTSNNVIQEEDGFNAKLTATAPDVVLVSLREHRIDIISELGYDERSFRGIGYMQIEFDFKLAPTPP